MTEIVHVAEVESPVGALRLASTAAGLAYLELPHPSGRGLEGWLARSAPDARVADAFAPNRVAAAQVIEYLEGKRVDFDLPLDLRGTEFQRAVWAALLEIPYAERRSYAEIARRVSRPLAMRAVGAANGANPVPLIVPCHRVIASDGTLGGYGCGLDLKGKLLAMESARPARDRLL